MTFYSAVRFLRIVYSILFSLWFAKVYNYYFGLSLPTIILSSLGLIGVLILLFRNQRRFEFLFVIVLTIPFIIYPGLGWMMSNYNQAFLGAFSLFFLVIICIHFLRSLSSLLLVTFTLSISFFLPYDFFPDQHRYKDRLQTVDQTEKGLIHVTTWKGNEWIYYNHKLEFSTIDKQVLAESSVFPGMYMSATPENVLVLGGDNGVILSALAQFREIVNIKFIPSDVGFYEFIESQHYSVLPAVLEKIQDDPVDFLKYTSEKFDLIFIDFNDAAMLQSAFYQDCKSRLNADGLIIMHTGDYFKENRVFWSQGQFQKVGLHATNYHMQVPTLGEVSWVVSSNSPLKPFHGRIDLSGEWWTPEAQHLLFGHGQISYIENMFQ